MSKKHKRRGLLIRTGDHEYSVTIMEESDQVAKSDTHGSHRTYSWQRVPQEYESIPSGRLRIQLPESSHSHHDHWSDSTRIQVEGKLGEVVQEVEHRAAAEDQAREQRRRQQEEWLAAEEQKEAEVRRQWTAAMQEARDRAIEDHRGRTFGGALSAWTTAVEIRHFCAAMEQVAAENPERAAEVGHWVRWGHTLASQMDPTS
jgi:hypothetical protein